MKTTKNVIVIATALMLVAVPATAYHIDWGIQDNSPQNPATGLSSVDWIAGTGFIDLCEGDNYTGLGFQKQGDGGLCFAHNHSNPMSHLGSKVGNPNNVIAVVFDDCGVFDDTPLTGLDEEAFDPDEAGANTDTPFGPAPCDFVPPPDSWTELNLTVTKDAGGHGKPIVNSFDGGEYFCQISGVAGTGLTVSKALGNSYVYDDQVAWAFNDGHVACFIDAATGPSTGGIPALMGSYWANTTDDFCTGIAASCLGTK